MNDTEQGNKTEYPRDGLIDSAFFAANPGVFGMISDAFPVVTAEYLIAANGYDAPNGVSMPVCTIGAKGIAALYGDDEACGAVCEGLLQRTFGSMDAAAGEQPISRHAAVLSELAALRVLQESRTCTDCNALAENLRRAIADALRSLRGFMEKQGVPMTSPELFSVSIGACRVRRGQTDAGRIDCFVAGKYCMFLQRRSGMSPIRLPAADPIGPVETERAPICRSIPIDHAQPCALFLLSESACSVNPTEAKHIESKPGAIWFYRMRQETFLLRILTESVHETEFGGRAKRFFAGRANGRRSASGAMIILPGQKTFEEFRAICADRLHHVEGQIELLPDGYDPAGVVELPPLSETEETYISALLRNDPLLLARTKDALRATALEKLRVLQGLPPSPDSVAEADGHMVSWETLCAVRKPTMDNAPLPPPCPADVENCRRLRPEEILAEFRLFDKENDDDNALLAANWLALRDHFTDHWITLRPLFATASPHEEDDDREALEKRISADTATDLWRGSFAGSLLRDVSVNEDDRYGDDDPKDRHAADPHRAFRASCERSYASCLRLNAALAVYRRRRAVKQQQLEALLSDALRVLRAEGNDWICGRSTDSGAVAWSTRLARELPCSTAVFAENREVETDRMRSLFNAYVTERDTLFKLDTSPGGFFGEMWQKIMNGALTEEEWEQLIHAVRRNAERVMPEAECASYISLLSSLARISCGTGVLLARIRDRVADRRMADSVAEEITYRIAAVRASAYEDPDWHASVSGILTTAARNDYHVMVRRWRETRDLMARRKEAFEEYSGMYLSDVGKT